MIPQHEILEAAKEAGLYMTSPERIAAVESLVAIIERIVERKTIEKCAAICEGYSGIHQMEMMSYTSKLLAAAIRKLGDE